LCQRVVALLRPQPARVLAADVQASAAQVEVRALEAVELAGAQTHETEQQEIVRH
jgi:hypothetical protein